MSSFAKISIRFNADLKQFSSEIQNAQRQMSRVGKQMQSVGKGLTLGLTAPIVALGAASVRTFANFEQEMAKVKAISGATEAQFKSLRKNAEDLGATTRYAASEVAGLQLNFSKLGLNPDEIINATEATLNLALATGEDLANSATVAASTVRGFGLAVTETGRVTDVMAKSFSSSALDLEKFQTAMSVVAPVANVANQSLEETTGMLSVLVNAGIDASTAGTGLRNIFLDIADKGYTLEEALQLINTSTNKNKTSMELFGKRGATVATVLAANFEAAKEFAVQYDNAAGSAKRMADIMDNTLQGAFFRVKSAMESAFISLGEELAPLVSKMADIVANLVSKFKDLDPATKKIIVAVAGLAAAIGPVMLAMGFMISNIIPAMAAGFAALTGPIGLVIAAISGIAVVVYKNWDRIKKEFNDLRNYFVDLYNESIVFRAGIESVILVFKNLYNTVKLILNFIITGFKNGFEFILGSAENFGKVFKAALTGNFEEIPKIIAAQGQLAGNNIKKLIGDITADLDQFSSTMKKDVNDAVDAVTLRKKVAFTEANVDATAIQNAVAKAVTEGQNGTGGTPGRAQAESLSTVDSGLMGVSLAGPLDALVERMPAQAARMSEIQMQVLANAQEFNERFTEITANTAANFAAGFGELLGNFANGGLSIKNIANLVLSTLADMAIQVGQMAIGIGFAVEGIKKALQSLAGPVAIAAGIALVALGTFAKSALSSAASGGGGSYEAPRAFADGGIVYGPTKAIFGEYSGARTNPEVVAPLDKLKGMIADVGGGNVRVTGEFKIRNRELVAQVDSGRKSISRRT